MMWCTENKFLLSRYSFSWKSILNYFLCWQSFCVIFACTSLQTTRGSWSYKNNIRRNLVIKRKTMKVLQNFTVNRFIQFPSKSLITASKRQQHLIFCHFSVSYLLSICVNRRLNTDREGGTLQTKSWLIFKQFLVCFHDLFSFIEMFIENFSWLFLGFPRCQELLHLPQLIAI